MKMLPVALAFGMVAAVPVVSSPVVAQSMPTPTSAQYVKKAGAGDLYEKRSSQLVLATTHDPAIRRFATMMINDHTKSTQQVKAAAMRAGLHPRAPMLDAEQTRMIADLRAARGGNRDRLYVQQQAAAHQKALALHSSYAEHGRSAALRSAASKVAPVVQHHIDTLPSA